jgi:hypothetical protein
VLQYVLSNIGNISPSTLCGSPTLQFVDNRGSPVIPDLFTVDSAAQTLSVGPVDDVDASGNFYLRFKYYNSLNPARFAVGPVITFRVVDACNPPAGLTPVQLIAPQFDNLVYTIGHEQYKYEVPAFTTVPDYCADRIVYQYQILIQG